MSNGSTTHTENIVCNTHAERDLSKIHTESNCEEENTRKLIEERSTVLNITNIEELFTGLDKESSSTPIGFHSLNDVPDYIDKDKSEESRLRRSLRLRQSKVLIPVLYVSDRDVVMMEDISIGHIQDED